MGIDSILRFTKLSKKIHHVQIQPQVVILPSSKSINFSTVNFPFLTRPLLEKQLEGPLVGVTLHLRRACLEPKELVELEKTLEEISKLAREDLVGSCY